MPTHHEKSNLKKKILKYAFILFFLNIKNKTWFCFTHTHIPFSVNKVTVQTEHESVAHTSFKANGFIYLMVSTWATWQETLCSRCLPQQCFCTVKLTQWPKQRDLFLTFLRALSWGSMHNYKDREFTVWTCSAFPIQPRSQNWLCINI